jgi:hypothetical protein
VTRNELIAYVATIVTLGVTVGTIGKAWLARGVARARQRDAASAGDAERLTRIEQAVEAVKAVAVEAARISEGQRFAAKLLSERAHAPVEHPRAEHRSGATIRIGGGST